MTPRNPKAKRRTTHAVEGADEEEPEGEEEEEIVVAGVGDAAVDGDEGSDPRWRARSFYRSSLFAIFMRYICLHVYH